jgi:hypothetical protein
MKWEHLRVLLHGGGTNYDDYDSAKAIHIISSDGQFVEWNKIGDEGTHSAALSRLLN